MMDRDKLLQPYYRRVISILLGVTVAILLVVQLFPLELVHRLLMAGLTVFIAAGGWASIEWISKRGYPSARIIYAGIIVYNLGIAAGEFLLGTIDLSGLYLIRIVASGILWNYKAAFFSAFLASILQPLVAALMGVNLANNLPR